MERTATVTFWDGVLLFKILPFIDLPARRGRWLRAVNASIVEAPSSTRNAGGERDPEMRQTKKGDQWHFGKTVHAAVDAGTGHAVAAAFTPAGVHDICELHRLVRDGDTVVFWNH